MRDERNKDLLCTIEYSYSKENISNDVRWIAEHVFLEMRNKAIKSINAHFEEWNKEYEEMYRDDNSRYNEFIQGKENEVLKAFNDIWKRSVKLWADEEGDIAGKFIHEGEEIVMHMGIKLLNEKEWREYHGITHSIVKEV